MSRDLELIKQLDKEVEKQTGEKLKKHSIDDEIKNLNSFTVDHHGNVIDIVIAWIKKMSSILPIILKFQHLDRLFLFETALEDISSLKELKGLKKLFLYGSQISDISGLKELKGLTSLDLSRNQISDISSFKELQGLTNLNLVGNQISNISSLLKLKHLTQLDLRNNKITHLPAEVLEMGMEIKWERKLEENETGIVLAGNPLESPPMEIILQGTEAVREYFKALEGEKQALNEVKVLLVGDGAAGKTSLVKQLRNQTFNKNESQTHGINIDSWEVKKYDTKIKVRLWDFGGQEIMHATHQFFLSKRSLYILVLDGRKDEKTEYWLNHVNTFGGASPVMVVLNKIDENPGFEVNRRFLQDKYPNIKGFYRVSCASGKGIEDFKKALTRELAAVELIRTTWAKNWFKVKTRLEQMTENFISYQQYQDICKKESIPAESAQDTLVDYLNDLGVILHFKDFQLEDTHVLEPRWITNAVYKIINSPILSANHGVLELRHLKQILKPKPGEANVFHYPADKYHYIFQLMKKFELCFAIDDKRMLVPDLLAVAEPGIDFDLTNALAFRFHYNFLPKSIMPRFIVKRHQDIKKELRWRTGVVLEDKRLDTTALVKADEREKKIFIFVSGTQKRDYFAVLRKTFHDIHDSFEKLEVDEWIPLPDNNKIAVEYKELLGYERAGREEIFIGKLEKAYSVQKLLSGIEKPGDRQPGVINREIIKSSRETPSSEPVKKGKKIIDSFWKIAAVIGGLIAFLAALAAIIDSQAVKNFFKWLFG